MRLYRKMKVKVRSLDGDFFNIVAGVLNGDTLATYLFMICQVYVLRTSIDLKRENGFTLKKKVRNRRYPEIIATDAHYSDDIALLANTPAEDEFRRHSTEQTEGGICLDVNTNKIEYNNLKWEGDISTLNGRPLKLVDKFTYLGSNISFTKIDVNINQVKTWTTIFRICDLSNKIEQDFFQAMAASLLLYGYTTWTLTKRIEKKLDGNYERMLRRIMNKSWKQHSTKQQLYSHLPPISKTIQVRHCGHCWRSKDELISNILLWTPSRGCVGRQTRTYLHQLCADSGCSLEDRLGAMDDRDGWSERIREISAPSATWWWWWHQQFHLIIYTHRVER